MGFPVPVGAWMRGAHTHVLDEYVTGERALARGLFDESFVRRIVGLHRSGTEDHTERLWSLVNFEMWQRRFIDGEQPREQLPAAGREALANA
jgi:asparagine synthase (glutamine-hydrolysing)